MVVWARSAPEKQKTVTTQTAQSQIPRFPQSHRLRIFAPWISVDHHWQNSGFFGFFLALAAGRFRAPPHEITQPTGLDEHRRRAPNDPGEPFAAARPGPPRHPAPRVLGRRRPPPRGD